MYRYSLFLIFLSLSILINANPIKNTVTFSSDIPLSKEEFFYLTNLSPKQYVTPQDIKTAHIQLMGKKRFSSVDITHNHTVPPNIHFSLISHWLFKKIQLFGIWFGKHQYKDLYMQHPGDIFDITIHQESIDAIRGALYNQGYFACDIEDELIYDSKNKIITIKIHLKRNKRFFVNKATIESKKLPQSQIDKLQKKHINFLCGHHYEKEKIIAAKKQLTKALEKEGYSKIQITIQQCINQKNRQINLRFTVTSDLKRHFYFQGNTLISEQDLRTTILDPNQPSWLFSPDIICEQISYLYLENGFLHTTVSYQKNDKNTFKFFINEGSQEKPNLQKNPTIAKKQITTNKKLHLPLMRFGKIYLQSNSSLSFTKLMREIPFKEGDPWNENSLIYTRKRLRELDIFQYIHIQPLKSLNDDSHKPVMITLLDDDPLELRFRLGYLFTSKNFLFKRASTPKLGASVIIKNPFRQADKLSLDTDFSNFERKTTLNYQIPHLFKSSATGKCKAYSHKYIHPLSVGSSNAAYEAIQNGFLLGLSREFKPHYFWGINIGNEWNRISRVRGNMNLARNMLNSTIPYAFFEPNIIIDQLDDRLFPSNGTLNVATLKLMVPTIKRSWLCKIMIDHTYIYKFWKDIIGAFRIRWGHIFNEHFNQIMPTERFFLGGPISVRGYDKDAVPPLGTDHTIQGGSSMINGNAELRIPFIHKTLDGVVFQDIGVLSQSGFSGFKKKWHPTTGCGLRYHTPIGALRFDIGWKWKRSFSEEPTYAWYLTLGQAF